LVIKKKSITMHGHMNISLYVISSGEWQTWFNIGKSGFIPLRGPSSWLTLMWYPSVLEAGLDEKPGRIKHRATDYETYF